MPFIRVEFRIVCVYERVKFHMPTICKKKIKIKDHFWFSLLCISLGINGWNFVDMRWQNHFLLDWNIETRAKHFVEYMLKVSVVWFIHFSKHKEKKSCSLSCWRIDFFFCFFRPFVRVNGVDDYCLIYVFLSAFSVTLSSYSVRHHHHRTHAFLLKTTTYAKIFLLLLKLNKIDDGKSDAYVSAVLFFVVVAVFLFGAKRRREKKENFGFCGIN